MIIPGGQENPNGLLHRFANKTIRCFVTIIGFFILLYITRIVEDFKYPQRLQTFASGFMAIVMCLIFLVKKNLHREQNRVANLFFYYVIICLAIGLIKVTAIPSSLYPINQMDGLFSLSLLLGVVFYSSQSFLRKITNLYFTYTVLFFLLLLPFASYLNYADILGLNVFFLLLYPFLNKKKKVIVILAIILSVLTTSQRIYYARYFFFAFLLILFYLPIKSQKIYSFIHKSAFGIPLIAIVLAFWYDFNVFDFKSYLGEGEEVYNEVTGKTESSMDDTRTFIYLEAMESAIENEYLALGRTPYYGYDSYFQVDRMSRLGFVVDGYSVERISEVHIESIFTWFGIFGLVFYTVMLYQMSRNCITKSNNKFCKIIGLAVSFMWLMLWIEYSFAFTPSFFVYPLMLSLAYDTDLATMTDTEIRNYFYVPINKKK